MRHEEINDTNQDSDSLAFYKLVFKSKEPTIIDLIGAAGTGKTTFCQQFVDAEGKKILGKTMVALGNNTIIQTDIVILENTKSRLFLKARTKEDVLRDLILVALNIDSEYKFDIKKNITDVVNIAGIKKNLIKEMKVKRELFHGVYNLFRTIALLERFQDIAKDLQLNFKNENIKEYMRNNITNENLSKFLDDIVYSELKIEDFYGYRHEVSLDHENILDKTIITTNTFNEYKKQKKKIHEVVSYRLLFEQAILVLKCDKKAKEHIPEKFKRGVVFRDLHGHGKFKQQGAATNFEENNKIILIPAGICHGLIDDKFVEEFKNIIISDSKGVIVVITKIDKTSSYEKYTQNNYEGFIDSLKEQIVTTHNSLIGRLEEIEECNLRSVHKFDRSTIARMFIASFDSAYLSKITKDEKGNFDAEFHKIICKNKSSVEISVSDIEDIILLDNWHTLISSVLERKNSVSYDWVI
ncbi:MAG: hypothetical protein MUO60_18135 [Clostridiaceae bacterium]|nr:hypothetical protein [Clostridiaceae bacterium]